MKLLAVLLPCGLFSSLLGVGCANRSDHALFKPRAIAETPTVAQAAHQHRARVATAATATKAAAHQARQVKTLIATGTNIHAPAAINALNLLIAYQHGEEAANIQYTGRIVTVEGLVSTIAADLSGALYVTISNGSLSLGEVQCRFDAEGQAGLRKLSTGQSVQIMGKCAGMTMTSVELNHCILLAARKTRSGTSPGM